MLKVSLDRCKNAAAATAAFRGIPHHQTLLGAKQCEILHCAPTTEQSGPSSSILPPSALWFTAPSMGGDFSAQLTKKPLWELFISYGYGVSELSFSLMTL